MKKNVLLWALYDFANTPLTAAIGGLYLGQWIVLDNHLDDIWYGSAFAAATLLLLLTSPFWGTWSDRTGKRMSFITGTTFLMAVLGLLLAFVTITPSVVFPKAVLALLIFFALQYVYQLSLVFYNVLLVKLSTPKTLGKISGLGETFGEAGWILGPAILLPFATGQLTLLGEPGRGQVFLPAVLMLVVFGLPMIFWFKEPKEKLVRTRIDFKIIYHNTLVGLEHLIKKEKNILFFLLSFMLISDALLTAMLYFAIYLDQIYKIGDTQKFLVLASLQTVAIPSAYIFGKAGDIIGIKRMLVVACMILIITSTLLSLSSSLTILYFLAAVLGVGFGGFYATSRALLAKISPAENIGEYFGFFSTFERFASIIGPLTWGGIVLALKDYGEIRYRIAVFSLVFLMGAGTILLTKVKEKPSGEIDGR